MTRRPVHHGIIPGRPACATRRDVPDLLSAAQLDALLAQGWYRVGQTMIWCEVVTPETSSLGVVWTRVPLADYAYKKSLRRARRRVERDFDVQVVPAVVDDEHEEVYQRYLTCARGERAPDLAAVRGYREVELFDTLAVEIREAGRLVAFSWFDRGESTLQSILCAYDPDFASYGLGIYTMLREIQYGLDHGMDYFYSGYVICGDPAMDYKLRTGHVEVLDRANDRWIPLEGFEPWALDPMAATGVALGRVQRLLGARPSRLMDNPHHSVGAHSPSLVRCLGYPLVLVVREAVGGRLITAVAWDSVERRYELVRCIGANIRDSRTNDVLIENLWVVDASLGHFDDADELVGILSQ